MLNTSLILIAITSLFITPTHDMNFASLTAQKMAGEGAISVSIEADSPEVFERAVCTVKTRLEHGHSKSHVFDAYYAPFVPVKPEYVLRAFIVLNTDYECENLYYMYSMQDIRKLVIKQEDIDYQYLSKIRQDFGLNFIKR